MAEYEEHPIAKMFPLMEGAEFNELVDSVSLNGQREPVVVAGKWLLDGRNRLRACKALGIPPKIREFDPAKDGESVISYIIDVNMRRRHLTTPQRAVLGAMIYERLKVADGSPTQQEIADVLGVSRRSVVAATKLVRSDIDEARRVASGEKTLRAARPTAERDAMEERFRRVCGHKFAKAFLDGTVPNITREADHLMALSDELLEAVAPLVAKGWTVVRAASRVTKQIGGMTTVADLIELAESHGGEFVANHEGFEFAVTKVA